MKEQKVIVRDSKGTGHVCAVWGYEKGKVYVTSESVLKQIKEGKTSLVPIGFPLRDVFEYEPNRVCDLSAINWSDLKQWEYR